MTKEELTEAVRPQPPRRLQPDPPARASGRGAGAAPVRRSQRGSWTRCSAPTATDVRRRLRPKVGMGLREFEERARLASQAKRNRGGQPDTLAAHPRSARPRHSRKRSATKSRPERREGMVAELRFRRRPRRSRVSTTCANAEPSLGFRVGVRSASICRFSRRRSRQRSSSKTMIATVPKSRDRSKLSASGSWERARRTRATSALTTVSHAIRARGRVVAHPFPDLVLRRSSASSRVALPAGVRLAASAGERALPERVDPPEPPQHGRELPTRLIREIANFSRKPAAFKDLESCSIESHIDLALRHLPPSVRVEC